MTTTEAPPATRWTAQWKELYDRGHHDRPLHGMCRVRRHVSARRDRLRARGGQVHPLPSRRRARARQLHPRREGLHHVHACVPPVQELGTGRRPAPVRPATGARRDVRDLAPAVADAGQRRHGPPDGPGRRAGVGDADLAPRQRLHRRRTGVGGRGRRRVEGQAGRRVDHGRDPRHGGEPLHVLRQPARRPRRQGRRATTGWRWSGWGARRRRCR